MIKHAHNFNTSLLDNTSAPIIKEIEQLLNTSPHPVNTVVGAFFDARAMSCPMPLLKAKLTLRAVVSGESLYLIASDKNSQTDLIAYCQKNHIAVQTWISGDGSEDIFHFILTKNDENR